jgi:hypothetical protein
VPDGLSMRKKTLLLLLRGDAPQELNPIRIMKGLFIFAQEAPEAWAGAEGRYEFTPYYYGPYSTAVYADLDEMTRRGLVRAKEVPGRSWRCYALTAAGRQEAGRVAAKLDKEVVAYVSTIRDFVTRLPLSQLLRAVYERYPEYAGKSVFRFEE